MKRTLEAIVEPDGSVQLLEPLHSAKSQRAVVLLLDDESIDEPERRPAGATLQDLMPAYGILDHDSAREMMRRIEDEFENVEGDDR